MQSALGTPASELEVGIRTVNVVDGWPGRGHRLRMNAQGPPTLVAKKAKAKVISTATAVPAAGAWHELRLMATGSRTHVWLDGQPAGVFDIDAKAGAVLFNATRGDVEVRNLTVVFLPPTVSSLKDYQGRRDFTFPTLKREVRPNYPFNAMAEKVAGMITYEAVVQADGSVGAVILKSLLHPELEHAGLEAIRQWQFIPAILAGSPIATMVDIEMSFTLK